MGNIKNRLNGLYQLAVWIDGYLDYSLENRMEGYDDLELVIENNHIYNHWFIEPFSRRALVDFRKLLKADNIEFIGNAIDKLNIGQVNKRIAILSTSNVMFSGAFEFLFLYLAGFEIVLNNSGHKDDLFQICLQKLADFSESKGGIILTDFFPKNIDGWIIHDKPEHDALHNYFSKHKSVFVKQKKRFFTINGDESKEQLQKIADDIFIYWGFSPENIRKLFVPKGFNLNLLFECFEKYSFLYNYSCYANNIDYHRSVLLMNNLPFLENGFVILKEDTSNEVPIGCVYYEYYINGEQPSGYKVMTENKNENNAITQSLLLDFIKSIACNN